MGISSETVEALAERLTRRSPARRERGRSARIAGHAPLGGAGRRPPRVTLEPMDDRAHNVSAVLRLLLGFVVLSTVAGLLMAGLAIPAVGATGPGRQGRGQLLQRPAERVHRVAAGPAVPHPRRRREADRQPVRREPHHRAAEEDHQEHAERADRHRGLALLRARRPRRPRLQPGAGLQPAGRRRAGRLDPHPAVREDHPPGERPEAGRQGRREGRRRQDLLAQAPGAEVRAERRGELHQGPDPRGLPQPRLLRRPGLRRRGGRAQLLRRQRGQAQPGPGRPARRHRAAADGLQPGDQPQGVAGPAQHRARPDAGAGPGRAPRTSPRPRRSP